MLTFALLGGTILVSSLDGAPNRRGTTTSKPSKETSESKAETTEQAQTGPMVLSRRIVTKVDGVIVEDREASASPGMPMPQTSASLPQETVVELDAGEPAESTEAIAEQNEAETLTAEQETSQAVAEESGGGFFDNFFNPQRTVESSGNRFGKRRGTRIREEKATETVEAPVYEPLVMPEEPVFVGASPNIVVGRIVSVNPAEGIAVVWMESRFINLERDVVTRNHELKVTGVLSPTTFRNGRAYGLQIVEGVPNKGEEVVLMELLEHESEPVAETANNSRR